MKRKIRNEKVRKWTARRVRTANSVRDAKYPLVNVFRSSKHIYAQIVDPLTGRTLGGVSSRSKQVAGDGPTGNIEAAKKVGKALAELAREKQIEHAVFNRNGFLFHGRVKAMVEAAREAGLKL
jgi:large subunit ribosomal protein L18